MLIYRLSSQHVNHESHVNYKSWNPSFYWNVVVFIYIYIYIYLYSWTNQV